MSKFGNGGSVFPQTTDHYWSGMSMRDYFAGQALPSIVAATSSGQHMLVGLEHNMTVQQAIAFDAYTMADAMLAESSKARSVLP